MTVHNVLLQTNLTADGLVFHSPSVALPAKVTPLKDATGYQIDIPTGDGAVIRIAGCRTNGAVHSITAVTHTEGRSDTLWQRIGADALSPVYTEVADHDVRVTSASDDPAVPRKIRPVTMKIRQPGKPLPFLARFKPV